MSLKVVVWLLVLLFGYMGVSFMFMPEAGAASLGVTPLAEHGLNTLRGDFGGLFLGSAVLLVLGLILKSAEWYLAVAILMSVIAFGRVIGFVVDGNPTDATLTAFGFEIVITAVLILASRKLAV